MPNGPGIGPFSALEHGGKTNWCALPINQGLDVQIALRPQKCRGLGGDPLLALGQWQRCIKIVKGLARFPADQINLKARLHFA